MNIRDRSIKRAQKAEAHIFLVYSNAIWISIFCSGPQEHFNDSSTTIIIFNVDRMTLSNENLTISTHKQINRKYSLAVGSETEYSNIMKDCR